MGILEEEQKREAKRK